MFPVAMLAAAANAANAATESVVYSFQNNGKDGLLPQASLDEVNGVLYGTTGAGGTGDCLDGCGTIFSLNPVSNIENVLYSLHGEEWTGPMPGSLLKARGMLFGTTYGGGHRAGGMLFSLDKRTNEFKEQYYFCNLYSCMDGKSPVSAWST
jgi:uncharacterized repeat protein (TIGR03803 family)